MIRVRLLLLIYPPAFKRSKTDISAILVLNTYKESSLGRKSLKTKIRGENNKDTL